MSAPQPQGGPGTGSIPSAALDDAPSWEVALAEIGRLRQALAYEARVLDAHTRTRGFPTSRKAAAAAQVERMEQAAAGLSASAYAAIGDGALQHAIRFAGGRTNVEVTEFLAPGA